MDKYVSRTGLSALINVSSKHIISDEKRLMICPAGVVTIHVYDAPNTVASNLRCSSRLTLHAPAYRSSRDIAKMVT